MINVVNKEWTEESASCSQIDDGLSSYFLNRQTGNSLSYFIERIQEQILLEPAFISSSTSEISINEFETKKFKFVIENSNWKEVSILLENIKGESRLLASFDFVVEEETENDEYQNKPLKEQLAVQNLKVPEKNSVLYIEVTGIEEVNVFKIKISEKQNTNSLTVVKKSNKFILEFLLILVFCLMK